MLQHERLRNKYKAATKRAAYNALKSYTDKFLKDAEGMQTIGDIQSLSSKELNSEAVQDMLTKVYKRVGADFAKLTIKDLNEKKARRIDIDYWEEYFVQYSRKNLGSKISWITGTTKEIIQQVVSKVGTIAGEEGWSIATFRNKLRGEFDFMNKYRAERIARTELMTASNAGIFEGGKQAGIAVKKEWIPIVDDSSRPDHAAMTGAGAIGMDEAFNVGGVMMMQPGDEAGGAEHVINCRCALNIVPDTTYEDILNS